MTANAEKMKRKLKPINTENAMSRKIEEEGRFQEEEGNKNTFFLGSKSGKFGES